MPRAQRMRIVNFPYDSNSKYIGDLLLDFNSEDSLIKLANGGGKTSLILLMAMCVDPTIKIGDRSILTYFQNYRTTTHIAVEWLLDGEGKRYLLTGMTVRSNGQDVSYFTYTVQYGWQNDFDLEHIPWIRHGSSGRQLVGYHEFLEYLEKQPDGGREQRPRVFQSTEYGRKKYTEFLKSYAILKEEWKAMAKANVAEGGVDAIFNEQRTSGELVKKSFLPIIESVVLPPGEVKGSALFDTVKAFVRNLVALPQIQQQALYYEEFLRRGEAWQTGAEAYQAAAARETAERERAAVLVKSAGHAVNQSTEQVLALEAQLSALTQTISQLEYQEASSLYHEQAVEAVKVRRELTDLLEKIAELEHERQGFKQEIKLLRARQVFDEWNELRSTVEKEQEDLRQATLSNAETVADVNAYAAQLLPLLATDLEQISALLHEREQSVRRQEQAIYELRHVTQPRLDEQYTQVVQKLQEVSSRDQAHKREELKLRKQLGILNMFFDTRQEIASREDQLQQCRKEQAEKEIQLKDNAVLTRRLEEEAEHLADSFKDLAVASANAANQVNEFEAQLEEVRRVAGYYQTDTKDVYSGRTLSEIRLRASKQQGLLIQERRKLHVLQMQTELVGEESYCLPNAEVKRAVEEINRRFSAQEALAGSEYLYQQDNREQAEWYLRRYPLLPYSVVMTAKGLQAIDAQTVKAISARFAVPIILREVLGGEPVIQDAFIYRPLDEIAFLLPYETEHYLSKDVLADLRASLRNQTVSTLQAVANLEKSLNEYASHSKVIENHCQRYPSGGEVLYQALQAATGREQTTQQRQAQVKVNLLSERSRCGELDTAVARLKQTAVDTIRELDLLADFLAAEEQVNALRSQQSGLENRSRLLKQEKSDAIAAEEKLRDALTSLRQELHNLAQAIGDKNAFMATVQQSLQPQIAASVLEPVNDLNSLTGRWQAAMDKLAGLTSGTRELAARLEKDRHSLRKKAEQFASCDVAVDQLYTVTYSYSRITDFETVLEKTEQAIKQASTEQGMWQNKLSTVETLAVKTRKSILSHYAKEPLPSDLLPAIGEIKRQLNQQRECRQQAEVGLGAAKERRREYISAKTIIDAFAQDEAIIPAEAFRFVADPVELTNDLKIVKADLLQAKGRKEKTRQQVASVFQTLQADFSKADMEHIQSFLLSFAVSGDEEAIYDAVAIAQIFGDSKALIENNLRNWRQKREELEREQQEIAAITARYLKDMIEQIKRIANLSKATIAGRTIAMMRIRNYEMTDQMLHNAVCLYVDRTIRELEAVGDNELESRARLAFNLQRLFAAIIPMERIEVEILKVREYGESEYVAWESLSVKNSGGEGFLSYFSVFLPLLTYIRDAEGAGSRTAKVFIADNPFGKMVSPHLVRVVMDMARRTNTQVIAFTGISDAKIYPFFDRIYSLSLFPVNASTKLRIEIEVAKEGSGATKLSSMDAGLAAGAKSLFQENLF